jgi:hypothetical protein
VGIINGIADKVVPKDGVRRNGDRIEVIMRNPLPKFTLKSFRVEQILEYAEIFVQDRLLSLHELKQIMVCINERWFSINDFGQIEEIKIPHKPHTIVSFPGRICPDSVLRVRIFVKTKKPIEIYLEREIQSE